MAEAVNLFRFSCNNNVNKSIFCFYFFHLIMLLQIWWPNSNAFCWVFVNSVETIVDWVNLLPAISPRSWSLIIITDLWFKVSQLQFYSKLLARICTWLFSFWQLQSILQHYFSFVTVEHWLLEAMKKCPITCTINWNGTNLQSSSKDIWSLSLQICNEHFIIMDLGSSSWIWNLSLL